MALFPPLLPPSSKGKKEGAQKFVLVLVSQNGKLKASKEALFFYVLYLDARVMFCSQVWVEFLHGEIEKERKKEREGERDRERMTRSVHAPPNQIPSMISILLAPYGMSSKMCRSR